jgi:hypothetical protein
MRNGVPHRLSFHNMEFYYTAGAGRLTHLSPRMSNGVPHRLSFHNMEFYYTAGDGRLTHFFSIILRFRFSYLLFKYRKLKSMEECLRKLVH